MTRTSWNLPNLSTGIAVSDPVVVVFLTAVSTEERDALFADLNDPEDEVSWPDRPSVTGSRSLAHIPWLRNFVPDTSRVVYEIMSNDDCGDAIFVDGQTMRERAAGGLGNVIVANSSAAAAAAAAAAAPGSTKTETGVVLYAAEVGIRRAKTILSSVLDSELPPKSSRQSRRTATQEPHLIKSLPDIMPDYEACKLGLSDYQQATRVSERETRAGDEAERQILGEERQYAHALPAHLPADLVLAYEKPTLVSLVHLEDSEMDQLKKKTILEGSSLRVRGEEPPIAEDSVRILNWPSDREPGTWREMHRIFSVIRPPLWQGYASDSGGTSALFIDKTEHDDPNPGEVQVLLVHQNRASERHQPDSNLQVAKPNKLESTLDVWHTMFIPPTPRVYGLRFSGELVSWIGNIQDPDRLVISGDEQSQCNVFILCPVSKAQMQQIREGLGGDRKLQLWDVSHLVTTPDVGGLVKLLESAEFRRHHDNPLSYFVAVDQITLDNKNSCIISHKATNHYLDDRGRDIGHDDIGYGWGRVDYESAQSMWLNYSNGNMDLEEDLGDSIQYIYWSHISEDEVHKYRMEEVEDL